MGPWVVPILAPRATGFREATGQRCGWHRGKKCEARRKCLEAAEGVHEQCIRSPPPVSENPGPAAHYALGVCVWCGYHPPLRLRKMKVLDVESLALDHTVDWSKAGILV